LAAARVMGQPSSAAHQRFFRLWHRTDMPKYLGNVRYWLNSGKHMLALSFYG
jgi:hypothetical protein